MLDTRTSVNDMNIVILIVFLVLFIFQATSEFGWQAGSLAASNEHMLDNEIGTDVTFLVGKPPDQQEIKAHRYILVSRSPGFFSILHEDASNTEEPIEVPEATPDAFKALLK